MDTKTELLLTVSLVAFAIYGIVEHGRVEALRAEMSVYRSYAQDNVNTEVYHR